MKRAVETVNSPLKGSIRTAAGTAAGSVPQTATTFCRLLRRFPPPPPPQRGQQCSREFLSVGSRHLAHYALVNAAVCWGGGGNGHPLVPVTHAMWAERGETASLQGGKKKFAGTHEPKLSVVGYRNRPLRMWHQPAASLDFQRIQLVVWCGETTGSRAMTKVAAGWIH